MSVTENTSPSNSIPPEDILEKSNSTLKDTSNKSSNPIPPETIQSNTTHDTHETLKLKYSDLKTSYTSLLTYFTNYKKYITGLLGYKIDIKDNKIILSSLYSFDSEDLLIFNIDKDNIELINNEFASLFKNEIHVYLIQNKSLPGFLSSVTLYLLNQKTFN